MKIIGIIVEYNPMHKGHLEHIKEIKRIHNESIIIAIMSGNIVQRGEFSIFDKFLRTKIAIKNNIDVVVQLPIYYSLNNANIFAKGAINILNKFGVEEIIFGSESNNLNKNIEIAKKINEKKYQEKLKKLQKKYHSLPKSFSKLFETEEIKSNDLLGICYISEGLKINKKISFNSIKRNNDIFDSASKIRNDLLKNKKNKFNLINEREIIKMDDFFEIIKSKIITTNKKDNLVINYIKNFLDKNNNINNWDQFITKLSNKNFTKSKLKREILKFFFEIEENKNYTETPRILGLSNNGRKFIKEIDFEYNTKFKKEYIYDLKIAKILNLKIPNYLKKEISESVFLK